MNAPAGKTKDAKPAPAGAEDTISATVTARALRTAIDALWKHAPDVRRYSRSTPILGCFTIEVADSEMRVSYYGIDMDITSHLPADGAGAVVVPASALRAFVAAADGETVSLRKDVGDARLRLECGTASASIIPMAVADVPKCFENLPAIARAAELAEGVFSWLTALPALCWSTEDTRYYLNGICFEIGDKEVRTIATNGHMLGFRKTGVGHELASWDQCAIVPREAMTSARQLIAGNECRLEFYSFKGERQKEEKTPLGKIPMGEKVPFEDPRFIKLVTPGWTITSKLIDGTFPDWRRVVPQPAGDFIAEMNTGALKRASAVAGKASRHMNTHGARFSHREDGASIHIKNVETGDFTVMARGSSTAPFPDFGVNIHYIATLAQALGKASVRLAILEPGAPIRIEPPDNLTGEFAILMPMRV